MRSHALRRCRQPRRRWNRHTYRLRCLHHSQLPTPIPPRGIVIRSDSAIDWNNSPLSAVESIDPDFSRSRKFVGVNVDVSVPHKYNMCLRADDQSGTRLWHLFERVPRSDPVGSIVHRHQSRMTSQCWLSRFALSPFVDGHSLSLLKLCQQCIVIGNSFTQICDGIHGGSHGRLQIR